MSRDDLVIDLFRSSGRLLNHGASVRVPELPRSTWGTTLLRIEAKRDPHVRRAYQAALDRAERTRQLEPQIIRRNCGTILDVR